MEQNAITHQQTESIRPTRRWRAVALSLFTHIALLTLALLLIAKAPRSGGDGEVDRIGEIVLAVVNEESTVEYLDPSNEPELAQVQSFATTISSAPPPALDISPPDIDAPGTVPVEFSESAAAMASESTHSITAEPYELSKKDLELIQSDRELLEAQQPKGPATTLSVFGSGKLTGRKFVFLIDRSHSMGDQGLGVLKRARIELTNAINRLEDHHQFQIIVYHNSTAMIDRRALLPATEENKKLVPSFLNNVVAYGGTNHQNGIYAALVFDPDVIVMMTDGGSPDLHDGQIQAIKNSTDGAEIHTIQFESGPMTNSNHFLQRLAEQTAGTFRYIDVREWRKKN